jgi:sporulation protein YlmC with PRC-barrel domain
MKGYVRASRSNVQLPAALDRAAERKVVCSDGRELGQVVDIIFDEYHTDRAYLEVESDGRLKINHKYFLTPTKAVDLDTDPIVVDMSTEELIAAPGHDQSMPFSEEYEVALMGFWGVQMHEDVEAVRDPLTERPGQTHAMRAEQFDSDPNHPHAHYRQVDRENT